MSSDVGDDLVGTTLAGYRIEAKLGTGATGVVFRARRSDDAPPVALKVLHDNLGSISSLRRRFEREARVLEKLEHPNVVEITDFGISDDGHTFIAMELLEGRTLEERLDETPLPPAQAIDIVREAVRGLAFAHARNIVHRDLKPANVFLVGPDDASVKLLDFGLAKMLSDDEVAEDGTLTRRGRIVGTPAYMAPEQITGTGLDVRADVYAVGVLLYELLADRRPFVSERRSELLRAHLLKPPPPLIETRPELVVDAALEAIVMRCLSKAPEARYPDAGALLEAIEALPPEAARLNRARATSERRVRAGATSEVISASERKAVSDSVTGLRASPALSTPPSAPASPPPPTPTRPRDGGNASAPAKRPSTRSAEITDRFPVEPSTAPRAPSGPSTTLLYVLAGLILAAAALLWLAFGPR